MYKTVENVTGYIKLLLSPPLYYINHPSVLFQLSLSESQGGWTLSQLP